MSAREMRRGIEGLEKEREGVKIGEHGMGTHAEVEGKWGTWCRRLMLKTASNEVVPCERFNGGMGKMKAWVRR